MDDFKFKPTPVETLPAVVTPTQLTDEVQEGVPIPYKVPDYEDAIPVGKSLGIVGGIIVCIAIVFFLAKTSHSVDLNQANKNDVDFSKMNGGQKQQGQVAGMQSYGPPAPSEKTNSNEAMSPTPTEKDDSPTPTSTPSPTPSPTPTSTPQPTNTPTPTATMTPTPSETPTPTATPTSNPTPTGT